MEENKEIAAGAPKPNPKPRMKHAWEKDKERDEKMVRGVFKNEAMKGRPLTFYFKKYPGPILKFEFEDGHAYTIPYMVAKHLHDNCYIPVHERAQDEDGKALTIIGKKIKQYDFISPDIIADADGDKNLITVQRGF